MDQETISILDERDRRYTERHASLEKGFNLALQAADKAVQKAETAIERRLEGVNEFRATLADQQRLLMPRAEFEATILSMNERITTLREQLDRLQAQRDGVKGGWGYAIGLIGFIVALLSIAAFAIRMVK